MRTSEHKKRKVKSQLNLSMETHSNNNNINVTGSGKSVLQNQNGYMALGDKSNSLGDDKEKDKERSFTANDDIPLISHVIGITSSSGNSIIHESRTATVLSCFINLASTIIGAGLLGMPYAFANMGWFLGFTLLTLCAMSSALALYFLTICARLTTSPTTFHEVAKLAIPQLAFLVDFSIAIKCFGVATSYIIIVGDLMPVVMHSIQANIIFQQRYIWICLCYVFLIPLSCLEHLDALKYTSGLSMVFVLVLVIIVLLYATLGHSSSSSASSSQFNPCQDRDPSFCFPDTFHPPSATLTIQSLKTLPVFIFGYTCQQNTFAMTNEMSMPTTQIKYNLVIGLSIFTAWLIYAITATAGFITYGTYNLPNLLANYPETPVTTVARACVSVIVMSHFPLQSHPCRRSVLSLIQDIAPVEMRMTHVHRMRSIAVTGIILLASFTIAMTVTDLGLVMSLVGSSGSVIVSYILPGMCYYYAVPVSTNVTGGTAGLVIDCSRGYGARTLKILALLQFGFGILLIPLCITLVLL